MQLFEEDREMIFVDSAEAMRDAALKLKRDDAARRRVAEAGWKRAHSQYGERLVAGFIEEALFRRRLSRDYGWPTTAW